MILSTLCGFTRLEKAIADAERRATLAHASASESASATDESSGEEEEEEVVDTYKPTDIRRKRHEARLKRANFRVGVLGGLLLYSYSQKQSVIPLTLATLTVHRSLL